MLADTEFAIGLEPAAHNRYYGAKHIICISFIASTPGHAFWDTILNEVRISVSRPDVLSQTGPLLMNRAYETFAAKETVRLLPEELVYPFTDHVGRSGEAYDIEVWERATRGAYVAHFWDATWIRGLVPGMGLPLDVKAWTNTVGLWADRSAPRISCLMASAGRLEARGGRSMISCARPTPTVNWSSAPQRLTVT